ncbi:MAG: hypothetical protein FJX67_08180 [Alphaproteobacteria bacterium]|nr:hypothetical protein [Alphaproteobacteria bacterium]
MTRMLRCVDLGMETPDKRAQSIGIIGAGPAGMAAAEQRRRVELLEASGVRIHRDVEIGRTIAFADGTLDARGRAVVVIGGGDTAMDCVRFAVRNSGADAVVEGCGSRHASTATPSCGSGSRPPIGKA